MICLIAVILLLAGSSAFGADPASPERFAATSDKVVCFGDSATEGASELSFPDYLEAFIEWGDGQVVNEGKSGETAEEGMWRMWWLLFSLKYINSHVWTYMEGGNDLIDWVTQIDPYLLFDPANPGYPHRQELDDKLAQIKDDLRTGIHNIRNKTSAEVVLGTYNYLASFTQCDPSPIGFLLPGMTEKANHYVDELNDNIRDLASEEDTPLADINESLGNFNGNLLFYHDCIHMNSLGNFVVALIWLVQIAPYVNG